MPDAKRSAPDPELDTIVAEQLGCVPKPYSTDLNAAMLLLADFASVRMELGPVGWTCSRCLHPGSEDNPLTADHRIAMARGGNRLPEVNELEVLCRRCNSAKGARL